MFDYKVLRAILLDVAAYTTWEGTLKWLKKAKAEQIIRLNEKDLGLN